MGRVADLVADRHDGRPVTALMTCSPVLVRSAGRGLCQPCDFGLVDMGPALVRPRLYRESSSTHILIGSGREVAVGLTSFVARLGLVG
jgi:hypothetical protein